MSTAQKDDKKKKRRRDPVLADMERNQKSEEPKPEEPAYDPSEWRPYNLRRRPAREPQSEPPKKKARSKTKKELEAEEEPKSQPEKRTKEPPPPKSSPAPSKAKSVSPAEQKEDLSEEENKKSPSKSPEIPASPPFSQSLSQISEWSQPNCILSAEDEGEVDEKEQLEFLKTCRGEEDYERLKSIGEGTYGIVYRARHLPSGDIVALKECKLEASDDGTKMLMPVTTWREIQILRKLDHPHLVRLRDVLKGSKGSNSIIMVFEYCEFDFGDLLDNHHAKFSTGEVKTVMLHLLQGIDYLHKNFIIHRDLKLPNMLLTEHGDTKLCDFGLARGYDMERRKYTPNLVTMWYRCPELLLDQEEYTTAVDMWAVGCILAELIMSRPLFPGKGEIEQLSMIFDLMGAPTKERWPGYFSGSLPLASKVKLPKQKENKVVSAFEKRGIKLSEQAMDLLNKLLEYDPKKRITAEQALRHPYFSEDPLPVDPKDIQKFESKFAPKADQTLIAGSSNLRPRTPS